MLEENSINGVYSPDTNTSGISIWDTTGTGIISWNDPYDDTSKMCFTDLMLKQCISQCELSLTMQTEEIMTDGCDDCSTSTGCFQAYQYIPGGSSNSYDCYQDFLNSEEYRTAVFEEQYEFEQAFS